MAHLRSSSGMSTDASLFEAIVGNYLATAAADKDGWQLDRQRHSYDFVVRTEEHWRVAIEVVSGQPTVSKLERLREALTRDSKELSQFLLVTPQEPTQKDLELLAAELGGIQVPSRWVSINRLPDALGLESPGDMLSPLVANELQIRALVKNIELYDQAPIGADPSRVGWSEYVKRSPDIAKLAKQLPYAVIQSVVADPRGPDEAFQFGQRISNATVLLSDLKNFSRLVKASPSDVLTDLMAKYYRLARQAVVSNGGMLDKFIGDAVLAVFGYPEAAADAPIRAIKCAQKLIGIGDAVLEEWRAELSIEVPSGTRVGIATGEIWPINIGENAVELSLLGDTINLAARLEANCDINGVLVENRTYTRSLKANAPFVEGLAFQNKTIPQEMAKGQAGDVIAWQTKLQSSA